MPAFTSLRTGSQNHKPDKRKPSKKKRVLPPPHMTVVEAEARIQSLTVSERSRIKAYFKHGTFKAAAEELQIDPHTVSDTWDKVGALFTILVEDLEKSAPGSGHHTPA